MTLIEVLEINGVTLRPDIHDAISASKDQFIAPQRATMQPQLLFASKWAQKTIPDDERVLRMGWASLGKRMLGAPILGMFVLTDKRFCFVRDDSSGGAKKCGHEPIQIFDREKIKGVSKSGGILSLKKIAFTVDGVEHKWERILGDNADFIVQEMAS